MYKVAQGERKNTTAATNNPRFIKVPFFMSKVMLVHFGDKKEGIWMCFVFSSV
jgi:hypothetical protein